MVNYKVKNKKVSLLLCIFLGPLGIHHFYNEKIGRGILYFFTVGLFFIGWIADIVLIAAQKEEKENNTNTTNNIKNTELNNTQKEESQNNTNATELNKKQTKNPIAEVYFQVAGVTFEDRQKIIKKIVNQTKKASYYTPYDAMTNKDIIEINEKIYELPNLYVDSFRLNPTTFKNEDAIEFYLIDENEKEYLVGYVPKVKIKEVQDFLQIYQEHPEYTIKHFAYFTGGKYKINEIDTMTFKDVVKTYEDTYGINVNLKLYDNSK